MRDGVDAGLGSTAVRREIVSHVGLRGTAALLVCAYHLQFVEPRSLIETAIPLFARSYLFVDLFFILSGFIISYVYWDELVARKITFRAFLVRRLDRLYPLAFFTLSAMVMFRFLVTVISTALGRISDVDWGSGSLTVLLAQFTLTNAWLPDPDAWNVPSWSISAELFAYVAFVPVVLIVARFGRPLLLIGVGLSGIWYVRHLGVGTLDIIGGTAPIRCLAGFAIGLALYHVRGRIAGLSDAVLSGLQLLSAVGIVAVLCCGYDDIIVVPLFAALVACTWPDRGMLAKPLGSSIGRYLGERSYSIYLNHVSLGAVFWFLWSRLLSRLPFPAIEARPLTVTLYLLFVLVVSELTFRYVELPYRRFFSRLLTQR